MGSVNSINDLPTDWVKGINNKSDFSGDFIYAKILLGANYNYDDVKKYLDGEKKH